MRPGQSGPASSFGSGSRRVAVSSGQGSSAGAHDEGGRGEGNGRACRSGGRMGWRRAGGTPQPCPLAQSVSRRRRMAAWCFTQRLEDKKPRGGKEFAPPEHPLTPIWKGRHALRAGPCLVRQRTCGRCRNLALDALSAQKTRGSHPWVGGPCGPLADNLGR